MGAEHDVLALLSWWRCWVWAAWVECSILKMMISDQEYKKWSKTKIWQCLVLSLADLGIQTRVELISFSSSWLKFSHLNHWTLTGNFIILNQKIFFFSFWKWQNVCLLVLIWFDSLIHCWPGSVWKCWLISELLSGKHHSTSQKLIPQHNFKHWQHFSF